MQNWQLALIILASVLIGALIPLLVMAAIAISRVGGEIAATGAQLRRTLDHIEVIAERVETLSLGLKGGETQVAQALASVGQLARGLDRNMKIIDLISTLLASVGTAIAAFVATRVASTAAKTSPSQGAEVANHEAPPATDSPGPHSEAQ
jgi:hypothetical protein